MHATQGDAVLIGFLSNFNDPSLASSVGEQPLGTDEPVGGGSDTEMDGGGNGPHEDKAKLERLAADADALANTHGLNVDGSRHRQSSQESRLRPTIDTNTSSVLKGSFQHTRRQIDVRDGPNFKHNSSVGSQSSFDGSCASRHHSNGPSRPTSSQTTRPSEREDGYIATSPALQQYAIIKGSPMETLPAMQTSPTSASRSPGSRQNLPSLASQVGHLKNAVPPPPPPHPAGQTLHRSSFSSNGALHSPPKELMRAQPYSSIHPRAPGSYQGSYPATEPSPASTNSAVSPREYRSGPGMRSMSPPSKFGPRQYQTNGLTPQGDMQVQTPQSAASTQPSMRTLSSDSSPGGDGIPDTERPILPPLNGGGPLINGGFKCDHAGCTAPPFQTQYLLK